MPPERRSARQGGKRDFLPVLSLSLILSRSLAFSLLSLSLSLQLSILSIHSLLFRALTLLSPSCYTSSHSSHSPALAPSRARALAHSSTRALRRSRARAL